MATESQARLTYEDLQALPEDNLRREIIEGELVVTAAPTTRHQRVVLELGARLLVHSKEHGGVAFIAPTDVYLSETNVVEPDVLYVGPENVGRIEEGFVRSAPDLVVEVSSPNTRRLDLIRKLELYQRFGVPEYWYVDLDADRVEVYRLESGQYRRPVLLRRSDALESPVIPGSFLPVDDLLGPG